MVAQGGLARPILGRINPEYIPTSQCPVPGQAPSELSLLVGRQPIRITARARIAQIALHGPDFACRIQRRILPAADCHRWTAPPNPFSGRSARHWSASLAGRPGQKSLPENSRWPITCHRREWPAQDSRRRRTTSRFLSWSNGTVQRRVGGRNQWNRIPIRSTARRRHRVLHPWLCQGRKQRRSPNPSHGRCVAAATEVPTKPGSIRQNSCSPPLELEV